MPAGKVKRLSLAGSKKFTSKQNINNKKSRNREVMY